MKLGSFARLCALTGMVLAGAAWSHEVRPGYLHLDEVADGVYDVLWKQPLVGDRRLALEPRLPNDCVMAGEVRSERTSDALIQRWQVACDLKKGAIGISGLTRTLTDVMVRIDRLHGDSVNQLLGPDAPSLDLSADGVPILGYLMLGIEHLVFGFDHILFVVGLVLLIRRPWTLLKTVTAFTLAHSVTLALSVLGWVRLSPGPVEVMIALSILLLARELAIGEHRGTLTFRKPWLMAFAFGLLHGFGFAGALAKIGLPDDALGAALLFFNLGIEVGQLMIVLPLFGVLWMLRQTPSILRPATTTAVYLIGAMATYWSLDRALPLFANVS